MSFKFRGGPAIIITAAFIGPGTITLCVLAGVQNGFSLLWAMMLSIFITIVIQNTTARISFTTRKGLAESLLLQASNPIVKFLLGTLLISAIFIGNAAYEAGNLTGALVGIQALTPGLDFYFGTSFYFLPILVGSLVAVLIALGSHKLLKNILIGIVLLMSISFVLTAILTQPNVMEVLRGMFIPSFNSKDTLTIVGILGTTCSTRVTQLILVDDKEIKREQESENNKKAWGILTQWSKPFLCLFSDQDPITKGGDQVFQKLVPGTEGQEHQTISGGHFLQEDAGPEIAKQMITFYNKNTAV